MTDPSSVTVLVTGGSGFVASHLILQLLSAGYVVRTTIRSLSRETDVRKALQDAGVEGMDRLSFYIADLTKDTGWTEAVGGCDFVQHVASPFPGEAPKSEDELIVPAREGTLRVLRAAQNAGVKRVVLTSSFAAIGYGQQKDVFTEKDWSDIAEIPAYHKSKTLAERASWEYIKKEGGGLELTVINPVGIFGPVLSNDLSSSIGIIRRLVDGSISACPRIFFNIVDVRDLADLHIRAMLDTAANGQRFIGSSTCKPLSLLDLAKIMKKGRPDEAQKVPTKQLPSWILRVFALFSPAARAVVPVLDEIRQVNNSKAKKLLGWEPRDPQNTILDTLDSLIKHHIV